MSGEPMRDRMLANHPCGHDLDRAHGGMG